MPLIFLWIAIILVCALYSALHCIVRVLHGTNILHTARIGMSCVAYAQWNKCDGIFLSLVNK